MRTEAMTRLLASEAIKWLQGSDAMLDFGSDGWMRVTARGRAQFKVANTLNSHGWDPIIEAGDALGMMSTPAMTDAFMAMRKEVMESLFRGDDLMDVDLPEGNMRCGCGALHPIDENGRTIEIPQCCAPRQLAANFDRQRREVKDAMREVRDVLGGTPIGWSSIVAKVARLVAESVRLNDDLQLVRDALDDAGFEAVPPHLADLVRDLAAERDRYRRSSGFYMTSVGTLERVLLETVGHTDATHTILRCQACDKIQILPHEVVDAGLIPETKRYTISCTNLQCGRQDMVRVDVPTAEGA